MRERGTVPAVERVPGVGDPAWALREEDADDAEREAVAAERVEARERGGVDDWWVGHERCRKIGERPGGRKRQGADP
jgi:hypothetical protein